MPSSPETTVVISKERVGGKKRARGESAKLRTAYAKEENRPKGEHEGPRKSPRSFLYLNRGKKIGVGGGGEEEEDEAGETDERQGAISITWSPLKKKKGQR